MSEYQPVASSTSVALGRAIEVAVHVRRSSAMHGRILTTGRQVTLRGVTGNVLPGEIATVLPTRKWMYAGRLCCSGRVLGFRLDAPALGLEPLALQPQGDWDPAEEYIVDDHDRLSAWDLRILARGVRQDFEMQQMLPGDDPSDPDLDPIILSNELREAGCRREAREVLMDLLEEDLRCLDAHAHLGNLEFERRPPLALRHYAVGVAIGALTVGERFDDVLSWGWTDNRPFLRCLNGYGLCLWRAGLVERASAVFQRMLWLNPDDNQGARFNLARIAAGRIWEQCE